ncbi:MAG: hypothetical protein IPK04_09600 [Bdellovibrionales bacterium]|nr:hypothetical protein [Bdellovibrionales bacterium]
MRKVLFLILILSARISFADSDIDFAEAHAQARSIKQNALAMAIVCVMDGVDCPKKHQREKKLAMYNLLMQEAQKIIGDSKSTFTQLDDAQKIVDYATAFINGGL